MGAHTQSVEHEARVIEQSVRDAFAAHVNPAITRLAQELLKIRAEIPLFVEEYISGAQLANNTAAPIPSQTRSLERIQSIQVALYSTSTFTLAIQLADRNLQLAAVANNAGGYSIERSFTGMAMLLRDGQSRQVTPSGNGPWTGYIGLHGEQLPTTRV